MPRKKNKILVVDDDFAIAEALNLALTTFGFEVKAVTKSSEVVSTAERFHPDLVILDYFLAGEDGTQLATQLRKLKDGKDLKIIMFSAHPSAKEEVDKIAVEAFIAKPFDINTLVSKVKKLLS